ncbi:MAG: ribonuclease T [Gammaproteobacteria bacterium]|nr:ribonuclease T [Gammaproteobacteria bacterium]
MRFSVYLRLHVKNAVHMRDRFRGFLPIVVDVETSGLDPRENALLEMAVITIDLSSDHEFSIGESFSEHISPFEGAILDPKSLEFNKIDPFHPLRFAKTEADALKALFVPIKKALKHYSCQRAVLVGHNAWFDLQFVNQACARQHLKSPFHPFTSFDTATLAGIHYGQTVLAKALKAANIPFDIKEAHSALYDAQKTAALFCEILNRGCLAGQNDLPVAQS